MLVGIWCVVCGMMIINGEVIDLGYNMLNVVDMCDKNMGYVLEDCYCMGLINSFVEYENFIFGYYWDLVYFKGLLMDLVVIKKNVVDEIGKYDIWLFNLFLKIVNFFGGN